MKTQHIDDIKNLLNYMGIQYLQSPDYIEAEQYGAYLCKSTDGDGSHIADYVLTTDSDVLAFGGNLLKYNKQKTTEFYTAYNYNDILRKTNLTEDEHIKMCVVMGSDFAPKTHRMGVVGVMNKVKSGNIDLTDRQVEAYNTFIEDLTPVNNKKLLHNSKYNRKKVITFLTDYEFNLVRITKILDDYEKLL